MNENIFMQGITVDSLLQKIEEIIDTRPGLSAVLIFCDPSAGQGPIDILKLKLNSFVEIYSFSLDCS